MATSDIDSRRRRELKAMINVLLGLIAFACLVYLLVAVLRPEKF